MSGFDDLHGAIQCQITRVTITASGVGPRVLVQTEGLNQETRTGAELLHPFGFSARPPAGSDAVQLTILGQSGHVVILGGDALGGAIADLAEGEAGMGVLAGTHIVLRRDRIEITSDTLPIAVNAGTGAVTIGGKAITLTGTDSIAMNAPAVTVNGHAVSTAP
jgi:phage gp45-like